MGLSKSALERNCPELSESAAEKNRGGHSTPRFVEVLKKDRFEQQVKVVVDYIHRVELQGKSEFAQRNHVLHLTRLIKHKKFRPHEVEAIKRVYREQFGELPTEET
jgi:hypothetical protein